jgi:hypothetical protein
MTVRCWVIAGNHDQYQQYVNRKSKEIDGVQFSYVSRVEILRGLRNPHGVFIGSWRRRDDILEILDVLMVSTTTDTSKLYRLKKEVWAQATHHQISKAAVSSAAQRLADAIDQEVLKMAIEKTDLANIRIT